MKAPLVSLSRLGERGLFRDGDWVESKDQDASGTVRLTQLADVGVGTFRNRSDRWMREDQADRLGCTFLQPADILVARMPEPLGRACLAPEGIGRAVTAVDVAILRVDHSAVSPAYVMWMINAPQFNAEVVARQSGTTRKRISRKNLAALAVPLPDLAEQQRIVEILEDHLSRLDAAETDLHRAQTRSDVFLLAALRAHVESARSTGASFGRIGEFATTNLGKMLDAKRTTGEPTPYLANINVRWGHFDLDSLKSVPLTPAERDRLTLLPGDLIVCEGGEPGRCAVWDRHDSGIVYQKALHRVRVHDRRQLEPQYLALMLRECIQSGRADRLFTGTTIKHLPQEKLRLIEVPLPDHAVQIAALSDFAKVANSNGGLATALAGARSRSSALRRALLAAAFSGKLTGRHTDDEVIEELAGALA